MKNYTLKNIFMALSVAMFFAGVWCFAKPFFSMQDGCSSMSCRIYVICGSILVLISLLLAMASTIFRETKNDEPVSNAKELHKQRRNQGGIQPDIIV